MTIINPNQPKYKKQEPYVNDTGIWVPVEEYVREDCASYYRQVISKELFIEAYNKWIRSEEKSNSKET